ncbi:hypothetical protein GCM10010038_19940 [Glutamicibacter protophormiae]|nr:hypothetical protein GCM10010038_19940 [Glutamicibacter protophormiae]
MKPTPSTNPAIAVIAPAKKIPRHPRFLATERRPALSVPDCGFPPAAIIPCRRQRPAEGMPARRGALYGHE